MNPTTLQDLRKLRDALKLRLSAVDLTILLIEDSIQPPPQHLQMGAPASRVIETLSSVGVGLRVELMADATPPHYVAKIDGSNSDACQAPGETYIDSILNLAHRLSGKTLVVSEKVGKVTFPEMV